MAPPVPARTRRVVTALLVPLVLLTAVGLVLLWPTQRPEAATTDQPVRRHGTVTEFRAAPCGQRAGTAEPGQPGAQPTPPGAQPTPPGAQPTPPGGQRCGSVRVAVEDGPDAGQTVTARIPQGPGAPRLAAGDRIVLVESPGPGGREYAVLDHQRGRPLLLLTLVVALAAVGFARWRGLAALAGLAVSFALLLLFVLPAISVGRPPLLVAVVGAAAIMFAVLYLSHGVSVRTSVAVLGTLASLVLTGLLGAAAIAATHLTGYGSEESSLLPVYLTRVDVRGLLLAGIIIGTLGVLDDVTVTQTALVSELAAANPALSRRRLYRAAIRVGRAHIAATVNTIVLAYAGASLPLLLLASVSGQPATTVLTGEFIAQEIVRSAVGALGLVAAVPLTTGLAAFVTATGAPAAAEAA